MIRVIETNEVVKIYFRHRDGVAYASKNGVVVLFEGEYEIIG